MRWLSALILAPSVALSVASPALARVAAIETTAALADRTEQSIEAAIKEALDIALRGAAAMGLTRVEAGEAFVVGDIVTVQILASDVPARPGDDPGSGSDGRLRVRVFRGGRSP